MSVPQEKSPFIENMKFQKGEVEIGKYTYTVFTRFCNSLVILLLERYFFRIFYYAPETFQFLVTFGVSCLVKKIERVMNINR